MKNKFLTLLSIVFIFSLFIKCSKDEPIIEFTLTTNISPSDGGTVNPSSGTFESGDKITLRSTPKEHYKFKNWSGGVSGTTNPVTVTMGSNKSITVNFELKDTDGDGIMDNVDTCSDTPSGETVDSNGCERLTYIPDDNFENIFISLGKDDILDDYVKTSMVETVLTMDLYNKNIYDLTGIEDFKNLTFLNVESNKLTTIDVSQNTKLTSLYFGHNFITEFNISSDILEKISGSGNDLGSINLSNCPNLEEVLFYDCNLQSVDLSSLPKLKKLELSTNNFTTIDFSNQSLLESISIQTSSLNFIDISGQINLKTLLLGNNNFTTIDLSNQVNLVQLDLGSNKLSSIDVSNSQNLTFLGISNNEITGIDLSKNVNLEKTYLSNNNITGEVDFSNNNRLYHVESGNNKISSIKFDNPIYMERLDLEFNSLTTIDVSKMDELTIFHINTNPLTCIQVSQKQLDNNVSRWIKDSEDSYSLDCN